ncbi:MAG TPA: MbtH family protein [Ktedonobacteraceae bacterium]
MKDIIKKVSENGVYMDSDDKEDQTTYKVVVNHEEQYSIWPAERKNASGWREAGKSGSKEECLTYIQQTWTDMRLLSIRRQIESFERAT